MILILEYFYWQFIEVPQKIIKVFKNLLWFGVNFFSIDYCLKTLFSPWKKIIWNYKKEFNFGSRIETFFSNCFSRIIGFFVRTFILLFWIIFEVFLLVTLIITLLLWILFPFIAILGIIFSFNLL
ncbi:MAG: hypothetical protein PHX52_00585 [Candidatus Pacebacteria bacterium]|nr:hypothetical protein [Candidatus Paceibacterota bacterium]MDD3919061.1 hypothetical protein [Candidatus Paceibacterota bacterium]